MKKWRVDVEEVPEFIWADTQYEAWEKASGELMISPTDEDDEDEE